MLPSREIVSFALAHQTNFFRIAPLVQDTSYCNSTPFASLLRAHSNSAWEESSGGPAVSQSPTLSPTCSYSPNTSLSQTAMLTLLYQPWRPLQASASAFNVIPLWSLGFSRSLPVIPVSFPFLLVIPTLLLWCTAMANVNSDSVLCRHRSFSWHVEMLPATLTFPLLVFPALPTQSLL